MKPIPFRVGCFAAVTFVAVLCRAQTPLVDLGQLELKVTEAKVVAELRLTPNGDNKIRAEAGGKLVVITLSGEIKSPGQYAAFPVLFAVLYEAESAYRPGKISLQAAGAHHIYAYDDLWAASTTTECPKPGPVTIRFAVSVPEKVQEFSVCIAGSAPGKVQLPPAR